MARFEINPTSNTPITPLSHTVDVGETVIWDIVAGAGIVEFAVAPDPVHFMKKDAQPGSPAIAIATQKGAKREFNVVFTAAPATTPHALAGAVASAIMGSGDGGANAGAAARLSARIIIR